MELELHNIRKSFYVYENLIIICIDQYWMLKLKFIKSIQKWEKGHFLFLQILYLRSNDSLMYVRKQYS